MYTITITYKDKGNKSCVDIFDNVNTISIDSNLIIIWDKDNKYHDYKYENVLIVQVVNMKLL